jgi:hypothetical protein
MPKVAQPQPRTIEYRHFVEGREVTPEAFYEALRAAGGAARVEVFDLGPREAQPRYRLTDQGQAVLERAPEGGR